LFYVVLKQSCYPLYDLRFWFNFTFRLFLCYRDRPLHEKGLYGISNVTVRGVQLSSTTEYPPSHYLLGPMSPLRITWIIMGTLVLFTLGLFLLSNLKYLKYLYPSKTCLQDLLRAAYNGSGDLCMCCLRSTGLVGSEVRWYYGSGFDLTTEDEEADFYGEAKENLPSDNLDIHYGGDIQGSRSKYLEDDDDGGGGGSGGVSGGQRRRGNGSSRGWGADSQGQGDGVLRQGIHNILQGLRSARSTIGKLTSAGGAEQGGGGGTSSGNPMHHRSSSSSSSREGGMGMGTGSEIEMLGSLNQRADYQRMRGGSGGNGTTTMRGMFNPHTPPRRNGITGSIVRGGGGGGGSSSSSSNAYYTPVQFTNIRFGAEDGEGDEEEDGAQVDNGVPADPFQL
jgi:hypothetical protein